MSEVVAVPAPQEKDASLMNLIAQMATDKDADIIKLEKLIDLQNNVLSREAKRAFAMDLIAMKPKLPRVISRHDNKQTSSKYAKLEDINGVIDPVLQQHGFATSTKVTNQTADSVTVTAELWHSSGHVEETTITMPLDNKGPNGTVNKTGPHATASSVTYAKRVALCALLNISTGDDKDGNAEAGAISMEDATKIDERARAMGDDYHARFMKYMVVEKAIDIAAKDLKKAQNALTTAEKQKSAAKVKS